MLRLECMNALKKTRRAASLLFLGGYMEKQRNECRASLGSRLFELAAFYFFLTLNAVSRPRHRF